MTRDEADRMTALTGTEFDVLRKVERGAGYRRNVQGEPLADRRNEFVDALCARKMVDVHTPHGGMYSRVTLTPVGRAALRRWRKAIREQKGSRP